MEVAEQIGHRLRGHLKTRHRWGLTTHDLMNQGGIPQPIRDADQLWCQQSLTGQPMSAGTVDAEQLAAVVRVTLNVEAGAHIGILLGTVDYPQQQHTASRCRQHHKGGDQSPAGILLFRCS